MINKFLILFSIILSYIFPVVVITDQNNHCRFDIRKVEHIGLIIIDSSFKDYVLHRNCFSCFCLEPIFFGTELQNKLANYIKESINLELDNEVCVDNEYIALIHPNVNQAGSTVALSDVINIFSKKSYNSDSM